MVVGVTGRPAPQVVAAAHKHVVAAILHHRGVARAALALRRKAAIRKHALLMVAGAVGALAPPAVAAAHKRVVVTALHPQTEVPLAQA